MKLGVPDYADADRCTTPLKVDDSTGRERAKRAIYLLLGILLISMITLFLL